MKNSTIDKIFLNQVTCIDIFNCNWLWYLVDAVAMLLRPKGCCRREIAKNGKFHVYSIELASSFYTCTCIWRNSCHRINLALLNVCTTSLCFRIHYASEEFGDDASAKSILHRAKKVK